MKAIYYTNGDIEVIKTEEEVPFGNYGGDLPPHEAVAGIVNVTNWGRELDLFTVVLDNGVKFTLDKENYQKAKRYFVK